jgi:hypothetical protein
MLSNSSKFNSSKTLIYFTNGKLSIKFIRGLKDIILVNVKGEYGESTYCTLSPTIFRNFMNTALSLL